MSRNLAAGIDVGSTTTKVVLADPSGPLASPLAPTGVNSRRAALALLADALGHLHARPADLAFVTATGYGRRLLDFADHSITEISANAAGALWIARRSGLTPRTIIDVGGQDSKVISLDDLGALANFAMNDKCAAGTGRFLEVMARVLELDLESLARLSLASANPLPMTSVCTVFAESEVVSYLASGAAVPDIAAGLHQAVAARVAALVHQVGLRPPVFFDGGPALNHALRVALEKNLDVNLFVPENPQTVVALGAALYSLQALGSGRRGKPFTALD